MKLLNRFVNAVRGVPDRPPRPGMLVGRKKEDLWREYPADGLTPKSLSSIFREADAGSLSSQMALFEQMEEKDGHLFSVANTRRLAVTGLPWEIVSAAEMPGWGAARGVNQDHHAADAAARFCDGVLRNLCGFEEMLIHLALALGRNIAVAELVWEANASSLHLAEIVPIDFERLVVDDAGEIRILTDASKFDGIVLPPNKFVIHTPHAVSGHPNRGGLSRVTSLAYLAKHFAIKDWLIFAEVFGMPVRIARYEPNATPQEKRELLDMLTQLGADATGIFSKAVEIELKQSRLPGETNLYENMCFYFDREMSKAWLGQTLTTDTIRSRASAGAAVVHDRVRRDLRDDDIRKEAHTIRRDLLSALTRFQFGPDAPVPFFRRILDRIFEPRELAGILDTAVNRLGARVPAHWVHATLGIPEAQAGETVLGGIDGLIEGESSSKER